MRRILLFMSSYIPLYILLITKNILERISCGGRFVLNAEKLKNINLFDEINDYAICVLVVLSIISWIYLRKISKRRGSVHYYDIVNIEDQSGNVYFNYISIYLLSCMGLTLNSIVDVFVLLFLMVVVGFVYIQNRMTYMNPTLQFLGFKIYECTIQSCSNEKLIKTIIIANKEMYLCVGARIKGSGNEDFVCVEAIVNEES